MSRLISIGTAVPIHVTTQDTILEFMHAAYQDRVASRKLNALFTHSGIEKRHSTLPDFDKSRNKPVFFDSILTNATIENKMDVFKEEAIPIALKAINEAFEKIGCSITDFKVTHLITVSCTGIYSPGMDAVLVKQLNLPSDIFHTAVNFIGCNAAFHALRMADLITKSDEQARVLIVCVELCTIHFQPKNDNDNLLSNTLFGDGAAAAIVTSDVHAEKNNYKGLTMHNFYSVLLDEGEELMGWDIMPRNFEMKLSSKIPSFIREKLSITIHKALNNYGIRRDEITNWAIHPGGKAILDAIKTELQLSQKDMKHSYHILKEYGNMSSPTILFVLEELIEHFTKQDETIFAMGFGPGLSIDTALFTYAN